MPTLVQTPLPVDDHVPELVEHVRRERFAVVVAPPGSGKTTRIPPALATLGRTILLQPRRVAARALTRRIAQERGWTIGEEIGWQIRFERRFSARTQLLVATEGILTARLQADPLLSDFTVVILDEFHERSVHADLALSLIKQAAISRDDLAVVVMSATMDAEPVSRFLCNARIVTIDAQRYPVEVRYSPGATVAQAVRSTIGSAKGDILCFLPGVREIDRTRDELSGLDALVLPLHGTLDVDAQERALLPASRRKVILATNVAETSLTVEGVTDVIDSGLHKVLRYDAETAVDHLITERISLDSAEQRAGRAGRTGPGRATRLWDARDILRPHREPEVRRIDLASTALDLIAWGGDPRRFEWFEPPPADRLEAAMELLHALGAIEIREQLRRLPLHPRLAKLVIAAEGDELAVRIAAALSEGVRLTSNETTVSDAFALAERAPEHVVRELRRLTPAGAPAPHRIILEAILSAYPDRVAMRREPRSSRLLLASGTGATLARESGVREGEFLVALDVASSGGEALVRMASLVERDWLVPTRREKVHTIEGGRVRAVERVYYYELLLHEQGVAPDEDEKERLLEQWRRENADPVLTRRMKFAGGGDVDRLAPLTIPLPSGRTARLEYRDDGSVFAAVKLQELFGLAETPRLGPHRVPITFELLAPNGRPVQVTRDLRSFWDNTYQQVRKELRARYPKHPWPEDPWTAEATHRTKRRS